MPGAALIMPKGLEGSAGFDLDLVFICTAKPEGLNRPYDRDEAPARIYNTHTLFEMGVLPSRGISISDSRDSNNYLFKRDKRPARDIIRCRINFDGCFAVNNLEQ